MKNVSIFKFKNIKDDKGRLIPIECKRDIPFDIKRIYYISDVKENSIRGYHSHRMLHQILICMNGSVKIKVENPEETQIVELCDNSIGLYIGPMIWREMFDFSKDAVLLVLASEYYTEDDYIRDYKEYINKAKELFN